MTLSLKKKLSVCFPLWLSLVPLSHPMNNGIESLPAVTHLCQSKCLSPWDKQGVGKMPPETISYFSQITDHRIFLQLSTFT